MIVIADTSPLITLWKLNCLHILPALYERVVIPAEVEWEILNEDYLESAQALLNASRNRPR